MQWPAFVKLHAIKPDLVIPVNSPWPLYPPFWQAHPEKRGGTVSGGQPITLQAERHDAGTGTIYFDVGARCGASRYLGLEMDIWRERPGNATVSWGQPGSFDANRSLTRFYPAGDATLQFAFKRNAMDHAVKVEATQGVDDSSTLRSLEPFRQPLEQAGFFVPKATPPGGEFRLHETRLFCLE